MVSKLVYQSLRDMKLNPVEAKKALLSDIPGPLRGEASMEMYLAIGAKPLWIQSSLYVHSQITRLHRCKIHRDKIEDDVTAAAAIVRAAAESSRHRTSK